jgi:hypothetical protein
MVPVIPGIALLCFTYISGFTLWFYIIA